MLTQLVEDFLHLERGGDGLDQYRGADGAALDAQQFLSQDEYVVPQPCFEVVLQLWQVVVRAAARIDQAPGVVEEVQTEVYKARRQSACR